MLPQDYEPYPDDGLGYGDYPKLPLISNDMKDPLYNWDMPDLKRNYGEPVNINCLYV
jgi:NADH dehydrogenase (ubiquinone) 1 beta subcomplex subunit 8